MGDRLTYISDYVAQTVKNLPAMQETQVQSPGQEDPLEKGMATYSSILAWRIPWTEEPGGLQSMGLQESDMTERLYNNKVHIQIIFLFSYVDVQLFQHHLF